MKTHSNPFLRNLALAGITLSIGEPAHADVFDVNGTTAGFGVTNGSTYDWWNANYWSDGALAANDAGNGATVTWQGISGNSQQAFFVGSGTAGQNYTVRLGSTGTTDTYIQNIAINANAAGSAALNGAAGNVTIGNTGDAGKLILNAANSVGAQNSGTLTINNGVNLNAFIMNYRGGTMIINGPVSGTGASNISSGSGAFGLSSGTLTLAGNNAFAGSTNIASGYIFSLQHANALGAAGGTNTVGSGGTMEVAGGVTIVSGESIGIAGEGVSSFGALRAGTGGGTWAGGVALNGTGAGPRIGATAGNTLTVTGAIANGSGNSFNVSGQSGTGVVLLNPTTSNTYTGTTGILRGILRLGKNDALPTGTTLDVDSAAGVSDAATFDLAGFNQTVAVLQDSATSNVNGLITNSVAATTSTLTVNQASNTSYDSIIANGSGSVVLTKGGAGALTLNGANTFTGGTNIKNGSIIISAGDNRLASGSSVVIGDVATSGKLVVGTSAAARSQTLAGLTATGLGGSVVGAHETNNSTLTLNIASGSSTFGGTLGGAGTNENMLALTKSGAGTFELTGANTFTGNVSITAGNLVINNSEALGTSATTKTVTINANGNKFLDLDSSIAGGSNITLSNKINYTTSGINGVIRNIAGNNAIEGTITMAVGNGDTRIISTGGSLTLAGTITANTGTRVLDLGGISLGDNTVSGVINNSNTPSLRKTDAGKWILTNANTFAGTTKVDGGTLVLKNNLAIQNSAFDTSGAGTLDLTDASINTLRIGGLIGDSSTGQNFILPANVTDLTLNQGGSVSYSKNFSGGAAGLTLTKSGSGTQILSGSNSYSGTTTISGGVLAIGHGDALGTSTAINVTNVAGTTLRIDVPDSTSTTVGTGKTVTINNTGLNFQGALQGAASTNTTWAGNVVIGTSGARIGGGDSGTLTIGGVISETTSNSNVLFSRAPNSTTVLGNVNTYIGDTQLFMNGSTVTLKMGIANAISSSSRVTVSSSTTGTGYFDLNGFNQNVRALVDTVSGDLVVTNSSNSADAELKLTSTDAQSFNGWIQDGATRKTSLLIAGIGSQTLANTNTFTGGTRIDAGILNLGHATNTLLDTGAVEINGGTLALGTNTDTVGSVTLTSGSITGSGAGTLTGSGSNFDVRSGTISAKLGGAVGLDKTTEGIVTISSDNSTGGYTGATTVSAGTLVIDGNISTSSLTTVNGTGILGGSGILGAVTIAATGTHNPGNSPGIVDTGDYTMAGTLNIESIGNIAGVGGYDQVNVTGVVNLSGTLNTQFTAGTYANGNLLFFLLNDGIDAITGTFAGLAQGAIVTSYDGFDWQISYNANGDSLGSPSFTGGNDIALMAIPEPTSALLSGLTTLLLLRRRRPAA